MKNLKYYIKESRAELEEITDWLRTIEDISDILNKISNSDILGDSSGRYDDNVDDHTKRYVGTILQRILNDPEIIAWYDAPYSNEVELKSMLANKLSPREITYLDEICKTLTTMTSNDKDAEIVNNAILRLIDDPDLEKWFKKAKKPIKSKDKYGNETVSERPVNEFELRKLINSKLNNVEKRFSEPIVRKFLRILDNQYEADDYYRPLNDKSFDQRIRR